MESYPVKDCNEVHAESSMLMTKKVWTEKDDTSELMESMTTAKVLMA
jgi:hypothetical protein